MCSDVAIRVAGLSKCYQIYAKPRDRLIQALWRGERKWYREFWALRDVSFEVPRGHTVGIIGPNGSGKSTLLQMIAGTLTPTAGEIATGGRVTALLELGAGFNMDFTGRENVLMNASIMGLSKAEIESRYRQIVEFSEIEEFIDQPVRTYSSGMVVRLAFSVAANLDPDILIVDEALAVGDVRFQRKCFRKFEELKNSGVTVLFVTHATDMVVHHCQEVLYLDGGRLKGRGEPREIVHQYLETMFGPSGTSGARRGPPPPAVAGEVDDRCPARRTYNGGEFRWGDRRAVIYDYHLFGNGIEDPVSISRGAALDLYMDVAFGAEVDHLIYGLTVKTIDGLTVYGSNTNLQHVPVAPRRAGEFVRVHFGFVANLVPGDYFVSLGVAFDDHDNVTRALDRRYDMIHLNVTDTADSFGVADLGMSVSESAIRSADEAAPDAGAMS